jgi:hypothetical protein
VKHELFDVARTGAHFLRERATAAVNKRGG